MTTATATTEINPILASLSDAEIIALAAQRHLKITAPKAKVEKVVPVPKTDAELLIEALGLIVKAEVVWVPTVDYVEASEGVEGVEYVEGHNKAVISVVPASERAEGTDAHVAFEALSLKARTTLEKIAASKRPAYTGAKRGPKAKTEGTDAPASTDETPKADETPAA